MQLSPLQLLEYMFDGISVMPLEGYEPEEKFSPSLVFFPGKLAMSADTGVVLLLEEKKYSDFGVKLTLRVGPKDDSEAPYRVEIAVRGVVCMHLTQDTGQAEERRVRALVNGVSLLYGVVREMVTNITARSIHGQMLLPSLNFSDLALHKPEEVQVVEKAKAKKTPGAVRKTAVSKAKAKVR